MPVSIHAPVKVRLFTGSQKDVLKGFNSRTREGATAQDGETYGDFVVSIHAPVKVRPFTL